MKSVLFRNLLSFVSSLLLVLAADSTQAGPYQVPLYVSTTTVPPNIMLILDTSGSMTTTVSGSTSADCVGKTTPCTRISIAIQAAKTMVSNLVPASGSSPTVRLGLATYNQGIGGQLWYPVAALDSTQAASVNAKISGFQANGVTPLATTLSDIGYYFATSGVEPLPAPSSIKLTLHPGKSNQDATKSIPDIFNHTGCTSSSTTVGCNNTTLLGFNPVGKQSCTTTTPSTVITPDLCVIPADGSTCQVSGGYIPPCPCANYVAGGADTYAAAAATDTSGNYLVTPIQMLMVCPTNNPNCTNAQPVICTGSSNPVCSIQNNFNVCQCTGGMLPCGSCAANLTGTTESIIHDTLNISTSPSPAVNNASYTSTTSSVPLNSSPLNTSLLVELKAHESPLDALDTSNNLLSFSTTSDTSSVCGLLSDSTGSTACPPGDRDCYINGLSNGICRICSTYAGSVNQSCTYDKTVGGEPTCAVATAGQEYCPVGWDGGAACSKHTDFYYVDSNSVKHVATAPTVDALNNSCTSTSGFWCDLKSGTNTCATNHSFACQQCKCWNSTTCAANKSGSSCSNQSKACTAVTDCYTATCDHKCSNLPGVTCSTTPNCYTSSCTGPYNRCSNNVSTSCATNSTCQNATCDNTGNAGVCSNNTSTHCSADSTCQTGSCDNTGTTGVCSNNSGTHCSADSTCQTNTCDLASNSGVCSNNSSIHCGSDSTCNPTGTCTNASNAGVCSNNSSTHCSADSTCQTATCNTSSGTGVCSNAGGTNSSKACSIAGDCSLGNCLNNTGYTFCSTDYSHRCFGVDSNCASTVSCNVPAGSHCSNNTATTCADASTCNPGVGCTGATSSVCSNNSTSACSNSSTCPDNAGVACNTVSRCVDDQTVCSSVTDCASNAGIDCQNYYGYCGSNTGEGCQADSDCSANANLSCSSSNGYCSDSSGGCADASTCSANSGISCNSVSRCSDNSAVCTDASTCPANSSIACNSVNRCSDNSAVCTSASTCPANNVTCSTSANVCSTATTQLCTSASTCPSTATCSGSYGYCSAHTGTACSSASTCPNNSSVTCSTSANVCSNSATTLCGTTTTACPAVTCGSTTNVCSTNKTQVCSSPSSCPAATCGGNYPSQTGLRCAGTTTSCSTLGSTASPCSTGHACSGSCSNSSTTACSAAGSCPAAACGGAGNTNALCSNSATITCTSGNTTSCPAVTCGGTGNTALVCSNSSSTICTAASQCYTESCTGTSTKACSTDLTKVCTVATSCPSNAVCGGTGNTALVCSNSSSTICTAASQCYTATCSSSTTKACSNNSANTCTTAANCYTASCSASSTKACSNNNSNTCTADSNCYTASCVKDGNTHCSNAKNPGDHNRCYGDIGYCYTVGCTTDGYKRCSNTGVRCGSSSGGIGQCYKTTCGTSSTKACSNALTKTCTAAANCYTETCGPTTSKTCSNSSSRACSLAADCYSNSCDVNTAGTCSNNSSKTCTTTSVSNCVVGLCNSQKNCSWSSLITGDLVGCPNGTECSGSCAGTCSNNSGISCTSGSGGAANCNTGVSCQKTCSNNTSKVCSADTDCTTSGNTCLTTCSNARTTTCSNATTCNAGISCQNTCSNARTTTCTSSSTCNTGVTCQNTCSNARTATCTSATSCNAGITCNSTKLCSNNTTTCAQDSDCNSGVACNTTGNCSDNAASCTTAGTCSANSGVACNTCSSTGNYETCTCATPQPNAKCVVDTMDIKVGSGILESCTSGGVCSNDGTTSCQTDSDCSNGGICSNGNTGGTKNSSNQCFNPNKYYTVQYNGSPDIMGPFRGDQLNWYFQDHSLFTEDSLELPPVQGTPTTTCVNLSAPIQYYCQKSFAILVTDGLPNGDRAVNTNLQNYSGDCATLANNVSPNMGLICNSTSNTLQTPGTTIALNSSSATNLPYSSLCSSATNLKTGSSTTCNKTGGACSLACGNGTKPGRAYETGGSDYLDDVTQALYEMDLRPDLRTNDPSGKNNLKTYAIGFADVTVGGQCPAPTGTMPSVLCDAAKRGGGDFYYANGATALAKYLAKVIESISAQVGSSASVATNSTQINNGAMIYQARFDTNGWFGNLSAFPIDSVVNSTTYGQANTSSPQWDAATLIPSDGTTTCSGSGGTSTCTYTYNAATSPPSRNILTYNPTLSGTKGTTFLCGNLSSAQQTALGISSCTTTTDQGVWRLNYIRGDKTHEVINASRVTNTSNTSDRETRSTDTTAVALFRNRTRLNSNSIDATKKYNALTQCDITSSCPAYNPPPIDPWLLGDIVNSNPMFVSTEDYGYGSLNSYSTFLASKSSRRTMIYVGASDGMLHGFDAGSTTSGSVNYSSTGGKEIVAYIPNAVYSNLKNYTSPGYSHTYFVDGSPAVGDAYFGSNWHTVLVGTTGAGGQGVFALDITNPGPSSATTGGMTPGFSSGNVLWEVSSAYTPNSSDSTEFSSHLGYTISQAAIVHTNDSSHPWVVLVANGYYSAADTSTGNTHAILYALDIQDGHIVKAIDAVNTHDVSTAPNGLSTPFPADIDGNTTVDYVYAGDLRGNLWKFSFKGNASSWGVANSGKPLYVAYDSDVNLPAGTSTDGSMSHRQPITARPVVGAGINAGTFMVYFGTGRYFDSTDNSNLQGQTFYGVIDKDDGTTVPRVGSTARSNLVHQIITSTTTPTANNPNSNSFRTTSNYDCNGDGWYLNLPDSGERTISFPMLRRFRVIFTTLEPPPPTTSTDDLCAAKSGTGWLMELGAQCGTPISSSTPPWDIGLIGGQSPSGMKSDVGIPTAPGIITLGNDTEEKYITGSTGKVSSYRESRDAVTGSGGAGATGRQSWRQIR